MEEKHHVSRREAMKAALKTGAYATPVVLSATGITSRVAAASPPPVTGSVTGTVVDAITVAPSTPIAGATVSIGGLSTTTDASGGFTLANVPVGAQTVTTSAAGYTTRTDAVTITANAATPLAPSLVPLSEAGNITIVLNWGTNGTDLDAHLSGPDVVHGGRFEVAFFDMNPVPYATLHQDVSLELGPETVTVRPYTGGVFVPGDYHYWAEHFVGGDAGFGVHAGFFASEARATVFNGGRQVAQFLSSDAAGNPQAEIWYAFNFTLTATASGQIAIGPVQQFVDMPPLGPGGHTVLPRPKKPSAKRP